uniref:Chromo domain-containing protein n=1 Tax=Nothobranchius furzeri TaxID=105023 RepID=A0A8C6LPV2_NOTFU
PMVDGLDTILTVVDRFSKAVRLPGAQVWLSTTHLHRINPVAYRLRLPASLRFHPPAPRVIDGEPAYTVCHILDARQRGQGWGWQYLVDWEDYSPEEQSWEPTRSILDPSLIRDFRAGHAGCSGAGRGGADTRCTLGLQQRIDKFDENRLLKALATNCVIDSLCCATLPKAPSPSARRCVQTGGEPAGVCKRNMAEAARPQKSKNF